MDTYTLPLKHGAGEYWRPTGRLRWANVSKTETKLQQEWIGDTDEWAQAGGPLYEWRDVPTVLLYEPDV